MSKNLPSVTQILREVGLVDFSHVPDSVMIPAQDFGTAFHLARHLWDKQTLDINSLSEPLIPYLEGYKKFKKDFGFIVKPDESERRLVSKLGFKGKPDIWPVIQGKRTLIDTKTSTGMYEATAIQEAGYDILLLEIGIKVDRRWGLQLKENGTYNIEPYTKVTDKAVFLSALTLVKGVASPKIMAMALNNINNWKKENL